MSRVTEHSIRAFGDRSMSRQPLPVWSPVAAPDSAASAGGGSIPVSVATHEDWVDVVRLGAVFLIVFGHTLNLDRRFVELPIGSPAWVAIDAITAGIRWALPVFLMISGYFLLDPRKNVEWSTYYRRRLQRLAWPLVVWTVIYLGIGSHDDLAAGRSVDAGKIVRLVISGAPYYHLWYLYMLPGLYVVSPFLKLATDRMSSGQLTAAVAMCFALTVFSAALDALYSAPHVTYINDFPRYLGYFLAGHLLGRVLQSQQVLPTAAVMLVSFLATASAAYVAAELLSPTRAHRLFGFGNPAVITLSLAAYALLRRVHVAASWRRWLTGAAETSFGVYLVHPAVLNTLRYWSYPDALAQLAAEVALVFLISLFIVLIMQRIPVLRRCV
jgi:surface polysaccharide O-acyltransferase-like enzyme